MPSDGIEHVGARNHLIGEDSPYLLSHADNPVDWYPWSEEALEKAKREDKPIFLSIGYAACHWCHVMEQESFENDSIAALLNKHYVSIKVDREERPDLDQIYMNFTNAMTGQGGWPMSVFLTPNLKPFFAGTYFPPDDRFGRPGFIRVITEIARAYEEEKGQIVRSSEKIFEQITAHLEREAPESILTDGIAARAAAALMKTVDQTYGGFGSAPKFPHSLELSLLLRAYRSGGDLLHLEAAEKSLTSMARGGIYDHLGGGFARYSTDHQWLVPHFEKMLYDNALLVPTYVEAFQITKDSSYLDVVRGILDFILNEMTDKSGGFYSSLDADSEGEEGKFYVWSKEEIDGVLGDDAELFNAYYNVTEVGNFERKNILHLSANSDRARSNYDGADFEDLIDGARQKLLSERAKRVRPLTDDKILASWNGLALSAFCRGYQVTGDERYYRAAVANGTFVRDSLYRDGTLTHSYREGSHSDGEFLEDYAYCVAGLLDLYETDQGDNNEQWLTLAGQLGKRAVSLFMSEEGRFYLRPEGQSDLIVRPKNESDGATPAPGSVMITGLLKMGRITGENSYLEAGEKGMKAVSGLVERFPESMTSALFAADYYLNDKVDIVIVGDGEQRTAMLEEIYRRFLPNRIIAIGDGRADGPAIFEGRRAAEGQANAFVCLNSVCQLPVSTVESLREQLGSL